MQTHLRIVFVTNNYTPYSGGVVSSINALMHELQKAGHEVFIITLDFLGKTNGDPEYVIRVPCPIKFTYKTNCIAIPWQAKSYIYRTINKIKPDIIHSHHPFLLGNAARIVAKKLSIPIIFTYHTLYEHYVHYIPLPRCITRAITKKLVLRFCDRINGIVVPSSAVKEYLNREGVQTPVAVIPSGLQSIFLSTKKPIKLPSNGRVPHLLAVSRFVKEKNIPFLFDVFKILNGNFILTLVGYGAEYESIKMHAYQKLKLSQQQVRFVHKPSKVELLSLYREADLFLFSSTTDTQGVVIAEAMASGTPVIAVNGPGQRDIIKNGYNGFLVKNAHHMAHIIKVVTSNEALLTTLQERAWQTSQQYAPDIITRKILAFYHAIHSDALLSPDGMTNK